MPANPASPEVEVLREIRDELRSLSAAIGNVLPQNTEPLLEIARNISSSARLIRRDLLAAGALQALLQRHAEGEVTDMAQQVLVQADAVIAAIDEGAT